MLERDRLSPRTVAVPTPKTLEEAMVLTMSYFDALGMAMTTFEIWQNLIRYRASYFEVTQALSTGPLAKILTEDRGYYSLRRPETAEDGAGSIHPGLEQIEQRFEKNKLSEFLWRRARNTARWLAMVPFVRSVSVANNVALDNAHPGSDIDLFITVQPGRLWTARFLVTAMTNLLGRRRYEEYVARRICLSFYCTDNVIDFEPLAISGGDLYLANWLLSLGTLWRHDADPREYTTPIASRFLPHNPWVRELFPQREPSTLTRRRQVLGMTARGARLGQKMGELVLASKIGAALERRMRRKQLAHMGKQVPTEIKTRTTHILVTDDILKFHEQDRRTAFRERALATYNAVIGGEVPTVVPPVSVVVPSVRVIRASKVATNKKEYPLGIPIMKMRKVAPVHANAIPRKRTRARAPASA